MFSRPSLRSRARRECVVGRRAVSSRCYATQVTCRQPARSIRARQPALTKSKAFGYYHPPDARSKPKNSRYGLLKGGDSSRPGTAIFIVIPVRPAQLCIIRAILRLFSTAEVDRFQHRGLPHQPDRKLNGKTTCIIQPESLVTLRCLAKAGAVDLHPSPYDNFARAGVWRPVAGSKLELRFPRVGHLSRYLHDYQDRRRGIVLDRCVPKE
jgi:hypothetical protein